MRIKDIKHKELRDLALKRCDKGYGLESELTEALTWQDVPEGNSFWHNINEGETPKEYKPLTKKENDAIFEELRTILKNRNHETEKR